MLVALLVLFGLGLGNLWELKKYFSLPLRSTYNFVLLSLASIGMAFGGYSAAQTKIKQEFRYERSLKQIGLWLNQNADAEKTVLLEPLGYVGYYSDRLMLDEVGLVTPRVVALKRLGIPASDYFYILRPDYYVLHCDDAFALQNRIVGEGLAEQYTRMLTIDPLDYDMQKPDYSKTGALQRNSCYDIWQRNSNKNIDVNGS